MDSSQYHYILISIKAVWSLCMIILHDSLFSISIFLLTYRYCRLKQCQVSCIICSPQFLPRLQQAASSCSCLKFIVEIDQTAPSLRSGNPITSDQLCGSAESLRSSSKRLRSSGPLPILPVLRFEDVEATGFESVERYESGTKREPNDLVTIIYTSGSTGNPKGAIFCEDNWNAVMTTRCPLREFPRVYIASGSISFILYFQYIYVRLNSRIVGPLSATSTRKNSETALMNGARVGCFADEPSNLFRATCHLRPTILR